MIPVRASAVVAEPQEKFCPKSPLVYQAPKESPELPHFLNSPPTDAEGNPLPVHEELVDMDFPDEDDEPIIDENAHPPLINLAIAFLGVNPDPTDEEFHALATAARVPPEELEEAVYRILAILVEGDPEDTELHHAVNAALEEVEDPSNVKSSVDSPEIGEFDGVPDLGLDPVQEATSHDGDPRDSKEY